MAEPESRDYFVRARFALPAFVGALLALAALASTRPVAAEAQGSPTVVVAHLTDIVSPATAQYVHRVVSAANDQGAGAGQVAQSLQERHEAAATA